MPTTRHNQTYRQENKKAFCAKKVLLIFNGGAKGSVGIYFLGDNVGLYDCGNHV